MKLIFRFWIVAAFLSMLAQAREILGSPAKWNRATEEIAGDFKHRGAAMQEARFVIDDIAPNAKSYHHRLMGYNRSDDHIRRHPEIFPDAGRAHHKAAGGAGCEAEQMISNN